ncbi:MAG: glycosyltransferase family 4 protein [Candidatus Hydrogenedentota bacterium]
MSTARRLLIVSDSTVRGGAEAYAVSVGCGIAARGWVVDAAFPHNSETRPLAGAFAAGGVTCHHAPFGRAATILQRRPRPAPQVIALLAMRRLLRRLRPDVVLFVLAGHRASMPARMACAWMRVPALNVLQLTPRQSETAPTSARIRREKRLTKRGQRWVAVSRNTARFLTDSLHISGDCVAVIPNAVEVGHFAPRSREAARRTVRGELGLPPEAVLLLTVARLGVQKAHDVLLDALPAVFAKHPHLHAVWLGNGEKRAQYEARLYAEGLAQRVHLLGRREDVRTWYHGADYFAFPTYYEGFPHAVLEAAAAGLPMVASAEAGVCEFLDENRAVLVHENSAEHWAAAVDKLLAAPGEAQQRAAQAANAARAYDRETMLERTIEQLLNTCGVQDNG